MDNSSDSSSFTEFTPLQTQRIRDIFYLFRQPKDRNRTSSSSFIPTSTLTSMATSTPRIHVNSSIFSTSVVAARDSSQIPPVLLSTRSASANLALPSSKPLQTSFEAQESEPSGIRKGASSGSQPGESSGMQEGASLGAHSCPRGVACADNEAESNTNSGFDDVVGSQGESSGKVDDSTEGSRELEYIPGLSPSLETTEIDYPAGNTEMSKTAEGSHIRTQMINSLSSTGSINSGAATGSFSSPISKSSEVPIPSGTSSYPPISSESTNPSPTPDNRWNHSVTAYFGSGNIDIFPVSKIPWGSITHLCYAFAKTQNASSNWSVSVNDTLLSELSRSALEHGVDLLLSIGGYGEGGRYFSDMVNTNASINAFVTSFKSMVQKYKLAGIDIGRIILPALVEEAC